MSTFKDLIQELIENLKATQDDDGRWSEDGIRMAFRAIGINMWSRKKDLTDKQQRSKRAFYEKPAFLKFQAWYLENIDPEDPFYVQIAYIRENYNHRPPKSDDTLTRWIKHLKQNSGQQI